MKIFLTIAFYFFLAGAGAQTLGGNAVYNFLRLPATPLLTAAGGVNVSYGGKDVGMTASNPALLNKDLNSHVQLSFNSFLAGIKTYALTGAWHHEKWNKDFGGHIYFVNYGVIPQTDASGNESGEFRPSDFVVQLSGAGTYLEKWSYGATLKFIRSSYGVFRSSALAVDVGIHYTDSSGLFFASLVAKNMGAQLSTYAQEREDLPFDMQVGITKRLAKAPLGFSFTAQSLHRFNILYNDTTFNNENEFSVNDKFFNKLMNHFVFAGHIYLGQHLEATVGYNHLRRSELNIGSNGNGLNGFSMGLRVKFQKLQVQYARASYQRNVSYNQLGLNLLLDQFMGKGREL